MVGSRMGERERLCAAVPAHFTMRYSKSAGSDVILTEKV